MSGNLGRTGLRRRARACAPMREFDRLPGPLRRWLAQAALPWSPRSARRIYERELRCCGDARRAIARLSLIEAQTLARAAPSAGQNGRNRGRVEESGLQ